MKQAQRSLVVKTLKVIGWLGIGACLLLVALAALQMAVGSYTLKQFIREILDEDELLFVFWIPLALGAISLWTSHFVKAGESD